MNSFFYYVLLGTIVTIGVTLVALPFGLVIGLFMALVHTYGGKILTRVAAAYSILLRGVPPIVLLFILFFVLSGSIDLSPFWAGSLSLGIVSSAYQGLRAFLAARELWVIEKGYDPSEKLKAWEKVKGGSGQARRFAAQRGRDTFDFEHGSGHFTQLLVWHFRRKRHP